MRLAMAYVRDHGVAEDVVQETWLTCLRTLDRFERRSSLKTWIFGILMNVARARRRKESRVLPFASLFRWDASDSRRPTVDPHRFGSNGLWTTPPDSWSNLPEATVMSREALDRVKVAIDALPEKQREIVTLRDIAGMDSDEVCELLAISATNQRACASARRRAGSARGALRRPDGCGPAPGWSRWGCPPTPPVRRGSYRGTRRGWFASGFIRDVQRPVRSRSPGDSASAHPRVLRVCDLPST